MGEQGFWHDNESYMNLVMNKWNMLADDTYIFVLHLKENLAWFSETTRTYFGIADAYVPDHYEVMRRLIHPDDFWEYEEGIPERVRGVNLGRQLCVRMQDTSGEYHMYSIHTDIVMGDQNTEGHLLVLLHNENVFAED